MSQIMDSTADVLAIENYVRDQGGGVSFAELCRVMAPLMPVKGEWAIELADNLVLWAGVSDRFKNAVLQLVNERRIHARPTRLLVYLIDGGTLKMPLAARIPPSGYKSPHWAPVVLNPGPNPKG